MAKWYILMQSPASDLPSDFDHNGVFNLLQRHLYVNLI